MSPLNTPYKIALLPPPGPAVLSLRPPSSPHPPDPSTPQLFHDALTIRVAVFVHEQACPFDYEIDADDVVSWHWVIYADDDDGNGSSVPAATIRLVPAQVHAHANANANASDGDGGGEHAAAAAAVFEDPDYKNSRLWDQKEPYALIGRLATRKEFRGRGYGRVLVEEALRWAGAHKGDMERELRDGEWKGLLLAHAQARLEKWYQGLGWRTDEGMGRWAEAGIQHVGMWRRVEITG